MTDLLTGTGISGNELIALILTILAGLATMIGGIIGVASKKHNTRLMALSLGFSAGVMLYVSMVQILPLSREYFRLVFRENISYVYSSLWFFGGIILIGVIDYFIPNAENDIGSGNDGSRSLKRLGMISAITIAIHNFPEGLTTFATALNDASLGAAICVAIALHNIPEGIATSMPIYLATNNKKKALLLCLFTGLTEPMGAIVGYLFLKSYLTDSIYGTLYGIISGIMVFIALEELIPLAHEYEKSKITIIGVIMGMVVMAASLIPF